MNKKIRILQVIGSLSIGGAETMIMNILRNINRNQFKFDFIVYGDKVGEYEAEAKSLGANIFKIKSPTMNFFAFQKELKQIIIKGNYDIVHTHTLYNNGLVLKIAQKYGINKRISHSHSTESGKQNTIMYRLYLRYMGYLIRRYATELIACGAEAGCFLYGSEVFEKRGIIFNNGIMLEEFQYSEALRKEARHEFRIEHQLVIGNVGRFAEVKNHTFLLDVFYEIKNINPNAILFLVGDGPLKNEIELKIQELGLEKNVILAGMREDVGKILQLMDVFVQPSFFEGFPVSLVEAQTAGLPCVASSTITEKVAITDLVQFMSLDEAPEAWARKTIESSKLNRRNKNDEIIKKGFDIFSSVIQLEEIYKSQHGKVVI